MSTLAPLDARASLIAVAIAALFAGAMAMISDSSPIFSLFALFGLIATALIVWSADPRGALLSLFLATLPVGISKAMSSEASVYGAAVSLYISDLFFLPLLVFWAAERFSGAPGAKWRSIHFIAAAYLAWQTVSAAMSIDSMSWSILSNIWKHCAYLVVIADMTREPRRMRLAMTALVVGFLPQASMMSLQAITGAELTIPGQKPTAVGRVLIFEQSGGLHFTRPTGLMEHPNAFADYMTFLLPPLAVFAFAGRRLLKGWWPYVVAMFLAAIVGLLLSLSRGGWISFAAVIPFLLAAGWRRGLVSGRDLATLAVGVGLAAAILPVAFPTAIFRITQSDQRSTDSRIAMMDQAALIIERHPILGVGLAGYNKAAQTNIPSSFSTLLPAFRETLLKGVVHNKYLLTFAESGVVGLALLAAFLYWFMFLPFEYSRRADTTRWLLLSGFSGAVASQAVYFLFDHFSYDVRVGMLFVTAGLAIGTVDQIERAENANSSPRPG